MLDGGENLKDTSMDVKDAHISLSYKKSNKLIMGLYMVTDIISESEPLRPKLRELGLALLSDINTLKVTQSNGVLERVTSNLFSILSMLELASTLGVITQMNHSILSKEFNLFKESLEDFSKNNNKAGRRASIASLFVTPDHKELDLSEFLDRIPQKDMFKNSIGQTEKRKIGVQTGGTLLEALSIKAPKRLKTKDSLEMLKKERRFEIVKIMSDKSTGADYKGHTITDIKKEAREILKKCSVKTIQRELISMVRDGVLIKEGSKRWSRYFLKDKV